MPIIVKGNPLTFCFSPRFFQDRAKPGGVILHFVDGKMKIRQDREDMLWTLADSGIDRERFEPIGATVYDNASGLWCQRAAR
jgi:hypothetical protein